MPIQIRELHIRVVVNAAESPPGSTPNTGGGNQPPPADKADADKDLIIAECVEQVMAVLRDKLEK
ncbi:hypothetical protein HF324_11990 [Chitinophaga oryzae]|uniref:Uncharacterized protein n=1 Tax=Chitinophaga oryzae TaxID=2725414 RepID=A0AAE6ZHN5_9BACT|nr:DUF5908 family protein [Chitinophaga oryzae]QJB32067.1 hypothetical protein HF329_12320 [Chitinophaga oryzae]QJB38544.1 hypothetical protein HF324_11990 [Chitinophaga oryzae]